MVVCMAMMMISQQLAMVMMLCISLLAQANS